jgi:hypothetical protein
MQTISPSISREMFARLCGALPPSPDLATATRCRAQGALMMRKVQAAVRTLQKMQSVRAKDSATQQAAAAIAAPLPPSDAAPPDPDIIAAAEDVKAGLDPAITPPDPAIVQAIVSGTSPILRALDQGDHKAAA